MEGYSWVEGEVAIGRMKQLPQMAGIIVPFKLDLHNLTFFLTQRGHCDCQEIIVSVLGLSKQLEVVLYVIECFHQFPVFLLLSEMQFHLLVMLVLPVACLFFFLALVFHVSFSFVQVGFLLL